MLAAVAQWWDGVELWLTQLWYPVQVAVLMVVLLPLAWAVATGADSLSEWVARRGRLRSGAAPDVRESGRH